MRTQELPPDDGQSFKLANDRPRQKPVRFENIEGRQRMLLAGLDCLSGQRDLFPTDGEENEKQAE